MLAGGDGEKVVKIIALLQIYAAPDPIKHAPENGDGQELEKSFQTLFQVRSAACHQGAADHKEDGDGNSRRGVDQCCNDIVRMGQIGKRPVINIADVDGDDHDAGDHAHLVQMKISLQRKKPPCHTSRTVRCQKASALIFLL